MLEGTKTQDRGPLFPGSSCFPLSPDHKHKTDYKYHTRGKHDQLNMIFNLLGTPTEDELVAFGFSSYARRYIRCFDKRRGQGIKAKLPHADHDMCDILENMLQFNPSRRITVEEALDSRLFYEDTLRGTPMIRDRQREKTAPGPVNLDFETGGDMDEATLRHYFCKEINALRQSRGLLHSRDFTLTRR